MERIVLVNVHDMKHNVAVQMTLDDIIANGEETLETVHDFMKQSLKDIAIKKSVVTFKFDCGISQTLPINDFNYGEIEKLIANRKFITHLGTRKVTANIIGISFNLYREDTMIAPNEKWDLPAF